MLQNNPGTFQSVSYKTKAHLQKKKIAHHMAELHHKIKYCYLLVTIDGVKLVMGFTEHLQNVTTSISKYDSLTELQAQKITVSTAHINSTQSSESVAW
jgi:hypothetical protein